MVSKDQGTMRVLLVEDKTEMSGQFQEAMRDAQIKVAVAGDARSAIAQFKVDPFDAVLIDLMLPTGGESDATSYTGIQLGAQIRSLDQNVLIVMYSQDIDYGRETQFPFYSECKDAGADEVRSRRWLFSAAPVNLSSVLRKWQHTRAQGQRAGVRTAPESDFATKAVVERLGGNDILTDILRQVVPGFVFHKVAAITGGYSGAMVLRVSSSTDRDGKSSDANNIVKISASRFSLVDELRRRPFEGTQLDIHAAAPRSSAPVTVGDWFAFAAAEVAGAVSLEHFLLRRKLTDKNKACLRRAVKNLLVEPACVSKSIDGGGMKSALHLRYSFLAAIAEVLTELTEYCQSHLKDFLPSLSYLERYLAGFDEGYFSLSSNTRRIAVLHGDLHCRNVLVRTSGQPVLIDFARTEAYPRLFDFANLDVDVMVRVIDKCEGRQWDQRRLPHWLKLTRSSFPLSMGSEAASDCPLFLRETLHQALTDDVPSVSQHEYAEVVLFQLLRYLRFPTVPLPKRILCVQWAADIIEKFGMAK